VPGGCGWACGDHEPGVDAGLEAVGARPHAWVGRLVGPGEIRGSAVGHLHQTPNAHRAGARSEPHRVQDLGPAEGAAGDRQKVAASQGGLAEAHAGRRNRPRAGGGNGDRGCWSRPQAQAGGKDGHNPSAFAGRRAISRQLSSAGDGDPGPGRAKKAGSLGRRLAVCISPGRHRRSGIRLGLTQPVARPRGRSARSRAAGASVGPD
jgi:hypothetical protein